MRVGTEKKVAIPKRCPICSAPVERITIAEKGDEKSAALFCTNPRCFAQEKECIIHFVSKKAFDIDGLGEKIVEQLMNEGLIKNVADIFTLKQGDLEPLERFAEKSAVNLIQAIQTAKKVTLSRFIFALGIRHVGEETAFRLAEEFGTIDRVMDVSLDELKKVSDVGPRVAGSIHKFFQGMESRKMIKELRKNGVMIEKQKKKEAKKQGKLSGKSFVLTGTLETLTRDEAKEKIRSFGGDISESVSKKTNYVVVGKEPGSKFIRAKSLGVTILTGDKFLELLG